MFQKMLAFLVFLPFCFCAEEIIFTNQDAEGNFIELVTEKGNYFGSPVASEFSQLKQSIKKVKGQKLKVAIAGVLKVKLPERGETYHNVDFYEDGEWIRSASTRAQEFWIEIRIKDKDKASGDDVLLSGYQKLILPYLSDGKSAMGQNSLYQGKFKLLYTISFADVKKALGTMDTPELYAEVIVPQRLGDESAKTEKERVYIDSDGYEEDNAETGSNMLKGIEVR